MVVVAAVETLFVRTDEGIPEALGMRLEGIVGGLDPALRSLEACDNTIAVGFADQFRAIGVTRAKVNPGGGIEQARLGEFRAQVLELNGPSSSRLP